LTLKEFLVDPLRIVTKELAVNELLLLISKAVLLVDTAREEVLKTLKTQEILQAIMQVVL
jgi:hypothetical protein